MTQHFLVCTLPASFLISLQLSSFPPPPATIAIRKFDPDTPIVALTANATTEDRDNCLDAGMNNFLSKPIHVTTLGQILSKVAAAIANSETESSGEGVPETLEAVVRLLAPPA